MSDSDVEKMSDELEAVLAKMAPDGTIVSSYIVIYEYVDSEAKFLDEVHGEGVTPWLKRGMLLEIADRDEEDDDE